jgi:tRNA(Ile)-lysidine synthase
VNNGACPRALDARSILLHASRHPLAHVASQGLADAGVEASDPLVLAVSGGGDSMAMLVLLAAIRSRTDRALTSLSAVSVDHGIRADNAAEASFACETARALGIAASEVIPVDVRRDGNLLDAARDARLRALSDYAYARGAAKIALAHQADDRAEGLLLGLARGGGLDGVASLRASRTLDSGVTLVRPLLRARRSDLRDFLEGVGLSWHDDPSNALRTRGAMRDDPSVSSLIDRLAVGAGLALDEAAALAELRDHLVAAAVPIGATSLVRSVFDQAPRPIRVAVLSRLALHAGTSIPRPVLEQCARLSADDRHPRSFDCGDGRVLRIDARAVTVD